MNQKEQRGKSILIGRIILGNFLKLSLKKFLRYIGEVENSGLFQKLLASKAIVILRNDDCIIRDSWIVISGSSHDPRTTIHDLGTICRTDKGLIFEYGHVFLTREYHFNDQLMNEPNTEFGVEQVIGNRLSVIGEKTVNGQWSMVNGKSAIRNPKSFNSPSTINHQPSTIYHSLNPDVEIRLLFHRLRRISTRNRLTHAVLKCIIEHQGKYLKTGDPLKLNPLYQQDIVNMLRYDNPQSDPQITQIKSETCSWPEPAPDRIRSSGIEGSEIRNKLKAQSSRLKAHDNLGFKVDNSCISRLLSDLSIITPWGESIPLKTLLRSKKSVARIALKEIFLRERAEFDSGKISRGYGDREVREILWKETGHVYSVSSIKKYRQEIGVPSYTKRYVRKTEKFYPGPSVNFSRDYPLTSVSVKDINNSIGGVYELRLSSMEINYPKGRSNMFYIGSGGNIRKRLLDHISKNGKNSIVRDYINDHECSFRFIKVKGGWREEERRLYNLFIESFGRPPACNQISP